MTTAEARQAVDHRLFVAHECAHASAAVLLGLDVIQIRTRPSGASRGAVRFKVARARDQALVVLAAVLTDPRLPDPRWPFYPLEDETGDERRLRESIEDLGYDEEQWKQLRADALELTARTDFIQLEETFKSALRHYPVLNGELLQGVIAVATREELPVAA